MSRIEVVRVVSTHPATQGDFVEINATDFDPLVHTLYAPEGVPVVEQPDPPASALKPRRAPKHPT